MLRYTVKTRRLRAIALRSDFTGPDLRRLARGSKDASQARRLLAMAVIYDGGTRSEVSVRPGPFRCDCYAVIYCADVASWLIFQGTSSPMRLMVCPSAILAKASHK